jgi:hypothetical protein
VTGIALTGRYAANAKNTTNSPTVTSQVAINHPKSRHGDTGCES